MRFLPARGRSRAKPKDAFDERDFALLAVAEVELTTPLVAIPAIDADGRRYGGARVLVRLHSRPLGLLDVAVGKDGISSEALATSIWNELETMINAHLRGDGLAEVDTIGEQGLAAAESPPCVRQREALLLDAPTASVVICTRNRPDVLRRSLRAIEALDYPNVETIVVDGSAGSGTRDLVRDEFPRVAYRNVGANGIAIGRNAGARAASGDVVAYTDDDAVVDRHWLTELVVALMSDSRVACATGLVLPLELNAPAQVLFEESGAFTEGLRGRSVNLDMAREPGSLLPYATGKIGAGVSMAWRTAVVRDIGFDASLDTLTPSLRLRGRHASSAEDLSAFFDALVAGFTIVFEPNSIVYHEHRRTYAELERQLYWHGVGLGAHLTRCLIAEPSRIPDFLRRVPRGLLWGFSAESSRNRGKSSRFPPALTRAEQRGVLVGPFAYVRGLPMARHVRAAERRAIAAEQR